MSTRSELQKENDQLRNRLAELEATQQDANLPFGLSATLGAVGLIEQSRKGAKHRFAVSARNGQNGSGDASTELKPQEIAAVDESEAIRLFCVSEPNSAGKRQARTSPIDPSRHSFQAVAFDPTARFAGIAKQYDDAGSPERLRPAFAR